MDKGATARWGHQGFAAGFAWQLGDHETASLCKKGMKGSICMMYAAVSKRACGRETGQQPERGMDKKHSMLRWVDHTVEGTAYA
jgi:hypothetical protein